ncbi:MAG: hypothetical protein JXB24_12710 [Bacteroidales bacterium]|nr:hypothetical protein [Bacteroidales bacterium]
MKTLRLIAKLVGISLIILGFNSSCKKDKDDDGEVITCVVDLSGYGMGTYTYTYREDDPSTWEDDFETWNDLKEYLNYMDAQYAFVDCD